MSADERPFASKKGEPKDRLETGWRCRRRRNEGLAPVREEIGSKRVRPKSGRYFPAVGVLLSGPGPRRMSRGGTTLRRIRPLSKAAAERRRLKKARKTHRSSATKARALRLIGMRSKTEMERTSSPVRREGEGKPAADWGRPHRTDAFWGVTDRQSDVFSLHSAVTH